MDHKKSRGVLCLKAPLAKLSQPWVSSLCKVFFSLKGKPKLVWSQRVMALKPRFTSHCLCELGLVDAPL